MSLKRPSTIAEVSRRILDGDDPGAEIKDFLHEFQVSSGMAALSDAPVSLAGRVESGLRLDAFLQALAVYLAAQIDNDPPEWTRQVIVLPEPWFASPGAALRNFLLLDSPAPFRTRNLFIDEDSLRVA